MICRICGKEFWDFNEYGEVRENICDRCADVIIENEI